MMLRNNFFINIFAIIIYVASSHVAYAGGQDEMDHDWDEAAIFVRHLSEDVFSVLTNDTLSETEKDSGLFSLFKKYVNTDWMGRFVLGRYFRTASQSEIKRYLELYHQYLLYTYVPNLKKYAGEKFEVLRITKKTENECIVQTKLISIGNKQKIRIDYRVQKDKNGSFKIIDIIGEGVSLITTQRSDFGGLISRKGVKYFIRKLEKKVNQLSHRK